MSDQEELIRRWGRTLRSLHASKNDPSLDDKYWENFALAMHRAEAETISQGAAFDEALAEGRLHLVAPQIFHQLTLGRVMKEAEASRKVYFAAGILTGALGMLIYFLSRTPPALISL